MRSHVSKSVYVFLLSLIVLGLAVEVLPVNADAAWLEDYSYRRLFFLSCNSTQTDYASPLTVINQTGFDSAGTAYVYNEAQADFEDLRITQSDGTTLLQIWNQTTNAGANCTVWAKYPATNTTYWLYWGNPEAEAAWNQTGVFINVISGVVGAWNMETLMASTVPDYSGNNYDGTAIGATVTNGYFAGKTALSFNGSDTTGGYIQLPFNDSYTPFTIIAYAKPIDTTASTLIGNIRDGTTSGWAIKTTTKTTVTFYDTTNTQRAIVSTTSPLTNIMGPQVPAKYSVALMYRDAMRRFPSVFGLTVTAPIFVD